MKLSQLTAGIATGYVSKGVQFGCTIALVPFLLQPGVLGLEGYGAAFTILGVVSVLGVVTAGVRISFDRSIAIATRNGIGEGATTVGPLLGAGTKILLAIGLAFLAAVNFSGSSLLSWAGASTSADMTGALAWATALVVLENGLYLGKAPLITRGEAQFVNVVGTVETLFRTGTILLLFSFRDASLSDYFAIHAFWVGARQMSLFVRVRRRHPEDLRGALTAPLRVAVSSIRYSGGILLTQGASFMVRRAPVIIASRTLGAGEAGFVALVLNTMQGYLVQILFSVVQPLIVPIASRLDLAQLSSNRRALMWAVEAVYCACVVFVTGQIALWMPDLVRLWLGAEYSGIVLPGQILLAASAVEISTAARRAILIGQGLLAQVVPIFFGSAVLSLGGVVYAAVVLGSWELIVVATSLHFLLSNVLGVNRTFNKVILRPTEQVRGSRFLAIAPIFAVALLVSETTTGMPLSQRAMAGGVATLAMLGIIQTMIVSLSRLREVIELLIARRDRSLFAD